MLDIHRRKGCDLYTWVYLHKGIVWRNQKLQSTMSLFTTLTLCPFPNIVAFVDLRTSCWSRRRHVAEVMPLWVVSPLATVRQGKMFLVFCFVLLEEVIVLKVHLQLLNWRSFVLLSHLVYLDMYCVFRV